MGAPSDSGPIGHPMPPQGSAGPSTAELAVSGMHCQSCAALIEEALAEQAGVRSASVDLTGARARIEYDSARLTVDQLAAAIAGAGYSATPLS